MTNEEFDKRYPLHAKLRTLKKEQEILQNFLDWTDEKGWYFCYESSGGVHYPLGDSFEFIIAQFLGIDVGQFRKEKDQIYKDYLESLDKLEE